MKLIKKTKTSICCGAYKNGKKKRQEVEESKEVDFEEILTFNTDQYGNGIRKIEDKIEFLEHLLKIVISKHPEDFRNYLEGCVENSNRYDVKYKIED